MGANGAREEPEPAASGGPALVVRTGGDRDATIAARLHAERITDGFLSFLGPAFLSRLYRRIGRSPGSFVLVAEAGGTVVGFIAGSADVGRLSRTFLLRDGAVAGLSAAPKLLRSASRVLETLRHGSDQAAGTGRGTELLAVAVDPGHQGQGVGKALVGAFLDQVTAGGGDQAYVVVGAANSGAIGLYTGAGFVAGVGFELHAGTRSVLMQWAAAGS
jgi:ribosomal protein S18 acetylase RimI-like enzyme